MRRRLPIIPLILIVFTVVLGIVISLVSSAIEFPPALKRYAFPLFLFLVILLCIIAVWQYMLQNKAEGGIERPVQLLSREDRKTLLNRMRSFWIAGVLEQSLHGAALLALGLRNQPDVLMNPWHLTLQESDQAERTLPANTRIIQVYDESPSGLLILGEPGSGKVRRTAA
jgi:hypothetical protein